MSENLAPAGRKVIVSHQKDNKLLKFNTSAKTFGELQTVIGLEVNIDWKATKAMLRDTKNVLDQPDSVLPEGDFVLFLFPQKVKSGMAYEGMSYNQLRSEASKRGLLKGVSSVDTKGLLKLLETDDKKKAKAEAKAATVAQPAAKPAPIAKGVPASKPVSASAPKEEADLYEKLIREMRKMVADEVAKHIPGAKVKLPSDAEIMAEANALKSRI